jgi:hypothetical protein
VFNSKHKVGKLANSHLMVLIKQQIIIQMEFSISISNSHLMVLIKQQINTK